MTRIVVLGADEFSFTGEKGEQVEVAKVTYVDGGEIEAGRGKGLQVLTIKATRQALAMLREVPGVYDAVLSVRQVGRNVALRCEALSLIGPVPFADILALGSPSK